MRKPRLSRALGAVTATLLTVAALPINPSTAHAETTPPTAAAAAGALAVPDGEARYILEYDANANAEAESESLRQKGIDVKGTLTHTMKASVVVATPGEIQALKDTGGVASIELDTRIKVTGTTSLWGLDRIDQRNGRDGQFNIGDEGVGVNVYVVDTGLNFSHTEFTGRVPAAWTAINDGNGANDCNGHGTHVAGTAAGSTYGVARKASIIPVRVVECDGSGWNSTAIAGIDWAVAHHAAGQPAVMNLSIGGFTSSSFDRAVQSALDDGITVVAAAGNDGIDACSASPARIPGAITVAATDSNDRQASWSDYGSCVDIQAPGVAIRSAWRTSPTSYNSMDGTSMAAPHVSGAAAVMLSRDRGMSPAQVHQAVISNATVGVVSANKGATPNRLLFLPGTPPIPPSCSNLKPGDAWAGVGTQCGFSGPSGKALTSAEAAIVPGLVPAVGGSVDDSKVAVAVKSVPAAAAPAAAGPEPAPARVQAPTQPPVSVLARIVPVMAPSGPLADVPAAMTAAGEGRPVPAGTVLGSTPETATPAKGITSGVPMASTATNAPDMAENAAREDRAWAFTLTLVMLMAAVGAAYGSRRRNAPAPA